MMVAWLENGNEHLKEMDEFETYIVYWIDKTVIVEVGLAGA